MQLMTPSDKNFDVNLLKYKYKCVPHLFIIFHFFKTILFQVVLNKIADFSEK